MFEWAFLEFGPTAVTTNVLLASIALASLSEITPCTLVRVRGILHVRSDQSGAAEAQIGAFGIMVVREPARAGGVGNVPTPITEGAHDTWQTYHPFAQAGADAVAGHIGSSYVIDSKAMRKVDNGDAIVVTAEAASGSQGFNVSGVIRLGFKLH